MGTFYFNKETKKIEQKHDQPAYTLFNLIPKGPHHGKHRRTSPTTHRDPSDGAGAGTGAQGGSSIWSISWSQPSNPGSFAPARGGGKHLTLVDYAKLFQQVQVDWDLDLEPKPPSLPYAGIRSGEIIGHRMWYVCRQGLRSLAHRFVWESNATIEGKLNEIVYHNYYGESVWGGVYAYSTEIPSLDKVYFLGTLAECSGQDNPDYPIGLAQGTVKLWGEVIEHENGWRAQYAKLASINSVWSCRDRQDDVDRVLTSYYESINAPHITPYSV